MCAQTGPKPNTTSPNNTHIEDFLFQGFTGTIEEYAIVSLFVDISFNVVPLKTSKPYVEGSCVSDPCWYAVPGATGKEVAILDLYPGTGAPHISHEDRAVNSSDIRCIATNVLVKDIFAKTETGAPVAVMCNSSTVS